MQIKIETFADLHITIESDGDLRITIGDSVAYVSFSEVLKNSLDNYSGRTRQHMEEVYRDMLDTLEQDLPLIAKG